MPNWISITVANLYENKVAALIDACNSAALGDEQENRAEALIQGVIDEVRNAISSWPANVLDEDLTTIPKSQRNLAVDLIIAALKNAIEEPLTPAEVDTVAYRRRQLELIMTNKIKVEKPDTAAEPETQSGPGTTLIQPGGTSGHPFSGLGTT